MQKRQYQPRLAVHLLDASADAQPARTPAPIATPTSRMQQDQERRRSSGAAPPALVEDEVLAAAANKQRSIISAESAAWGISAGTSAAAARQQQQQSQQQPASAGAARVPLAPSLVTSRAGAPSSLKVTIAGPLQVESLQTPLATFSAGAPPSPTSTRSGASLHTQETTLTTTAVSFPGELANSALAARLGAGGSGRDDPLRPPRDDSSNKTAWRCGCCGYMMLAIDQRGAPIALDLDAFGEPLPLTCPGCHETHTGWSAACPFDAYGNYSNVRTKLSNQHVSTSLLHEATRGAFPYYARAPDPAALDVVTSATPPARAVRLYYRQHPPPEGEALPAIEGPGGQRTRRAPQSGQEVVPSSEAIRALGRQHMTKAATISVKKKMAYFCHYCGRRLFRMGVSGELVPMDRDKAGELQPLTCPGCGRSHNRWDTLPFNSVVKPAPPEELEAVDGSGDVSNTFSASNRTASFEL